MKILIEIGFVILSYLLGSIPSALIISKIFFKIDIREHGSNNMGATNALRVMGMKYATIVFIMDALKAGTLVFLFTYNILSRDLIPHIPPVFLGLVSIIGHIFPIYVKFKGGKGVASATGVILACHPVCFIVEIIIFLLVVILTKYVSVGSIISIIIVFFLSFFIPPLFEDAPNIYFSIFTGIMMGIIIIDHLPNIKRLIHGTESKTTKSLFTRKKRQVTNNEETINKENDIKNK